MQKLTVIFEVNQDQLGNFILAVGQTPGIRLVKVEGLSTATEPDHKERFRNGIKNKGIKGSDLLLQLIADGKPVSMKAAQTAFESYGFASNTIHATINKLRAEGRLKRTLDNMLVRA